MLSRHSFLLLVAACLLLATGVLAASALAAAPPTIDWHTLSNAGGRIAQGAYTLDYTLGQPLTGPAAQDTRSLCAGFWCALASGPAPVPPAGGIYLPIVVKVAP